MKTNNVMLAALMLMVSSFGLKAQDGTRNNRDTSPEKGVPAPREDMPGEEAMPEEEIMPEEETMPEEEIMPEEEMPEEISPVEETPAGMKDESEMKE